METTAQEIRQPVRQENETLLLMAKVLEKNSLRNYGTVLGIQHGMVHATDGFSMLRWTPKGNIGEDRTLTPALSESPVKYPNCQHLWVGMESAQVLAPKCFESLRKVLKPSWSQTPIMLAVYKDEVILIPEGSKAESTVLFNPWFFMRLCKGLPKDAVCKSAVVAEDKLLITYESVVGKFEILLVATKKD